MEAQQIGLKFRYINFCMNKIFQTACIATLMLVISATALSQVQFVKEKKLPVVHVMFGKKHFTDFFFSDTIAKPVLYPIAAPNGTIITRGFPVTPTPDEPTDHPHHLGLWLNYENVNGLDFWNNSYAIPADKLSGYGKIKFNKITRMSDGHLDYDATWQDSKQTPMLSETTGFVFSELNGAWVIDRTTTLKALMQVDFKDAKDGMLGLRVAHALQIPTKETKKFKDANGIETVIKAVTDTIANGNYLNSNGVMGDAVWSTKAPWCMLYGKMGSDSISIVIIDHPSNVGYPTNWHARGYGLFAANPLGDKIFTNGKFERNFSLKTGESVTFKYRIVISSGKTVLGQKAIGQFMTQFQQVK